MNRDQRRAHRRGALAGLRRAGCACTPTLRPLPSIETALGPSGPGYLVVHRAGCPLGDEMTARNREGIVPFLMQLGGPSWGCER